MLYVDIPTSADIAALTAYRGDLCASIYLPTTPVTQETRGDRIELKNLSKAVVEKIPAAGGNNRRAALLIEQLHDLIDDDDFWRFQAHSLAVFVTPENLLTFRLPNALTHIVGVSNRFYVKPLLRSVSFPNACYVLALAQRNVRLVEVSADLPATSVQVEAMPEDAGRAVRGVGEIGYWPSGRIQGAEGQKVLLRQFARKVDQALRPLLGRSALPLILAAAEPLASIYRSVNTYFQLAKVGIEGSPENLTNAQLAERARPILDGLYRDQLAAWRTLFEERENQDRATTDIAHAARAATFGAIDSVLVDIDQAIPGQIDTQGKVTFVERQHEGGHDVIDEIAARVLTSDGRVIGVRKADIPHEKSLAAILRYPI
jgi:release factor family 11